MSGIKLLTPDSPIRFVKGVGEKRAALFEKLGVSTARDLLRFFPRDYVDKTVITHVADALNNEKCTFRVKLMTLPEECTARSGLSYFSFIVADDTGSMSVIVFGQKWLAKELKTDCEYRMYGTLKLEHFAKQLISPVIEKWNDQLLQVVPLYPLTKGFVQKNVTKAVKEVLFLAESEPEIITPEQRAALHLMSRSEAVREMHFPSSIERLAYAKKRLAFDELLVFQLGILSMRRKSLLSGAPVMTLKNTHVALFFKSLPFQLTGAQQRCIKEVFNDLAKPTPMSRLLQGDVGSGKTIVAAAAAYLCTANLYQCAVMAPTSILASQHYDTLSKLLEPFGIKCALLTGSLSEAEKNRVKADISSGTAQVIIGTHALLYGGVDFASLGLVVTDEQHRFGVLQRARLTEKGEKPHLLVMSATPIPRTLSLIMYGDLDLSTIDEMPPGRQKIDTFCVDEKYRARLVRFVRKTVSEGHQVYIICPAVEDNELIDVKSVDSYGVLLRDGVFSDLKVGLLHGKLPQREKDRVMEAFVGGHIDVLVSTTVVEVGVDVPNATLMIIENAERFGLSQLHQLRGRVGRGSDKSYCVLVSDSKGDTVKERTDIMCSTNDGFVIAQTDLRLRGPGEFIGRRQHGEFTFRVADLSADMPLMNLAHDTASEIIEEGLFTDERYAAAAIEVRRKFSSLGCENVLN